MNKDGLLETRYERRTDFADGFSKLYDIGGGIKMVNWGLGTQRIHLCQARKIEAFQGISIKMVAIGAEHTAAVTVDGEHYGWGWGRYGNLGLGDRDDRLVQEIVSSVESQ